MSRKIVNDSFRATSSDDIETLARSMEARYELALRKKHREREANVLFYLCSTLWKALELKETGKLTKNKDKELYSQYLLYITNL